MITPFRKPAGGELLDWQKEFNRQVNKIRYVIEQAIANFKTWRIIAHRLPEADRNVRYNHLSRDCPAFLQNRLNKPPSARP
jgi:hypothetical protein